MNLGESSINIGPIDQSLDRSNSNIMDPRQSTMKKQTIKKNKREPT